MIEYSIECIKITMGLLYFLICSLLRIQKKKNCTSEGSYFMRKRNISPERLIVSVK